MHGLAAVDGFGERLVDEFAHLGGGDEVLVGCVAAGDVGGAVAGVEDVADGGFDGGGVLLQVGGVAQDHGGGEDGAERVGLALCRRCRARSRGRARRG